MSSTIVSRVNRFLGEARARLTVGSGLYGDVWLGALGPTPAGVTVTQDTALTLPAVFAACDVIASTVSMLPIRVRRDEGTHYTPQPRHPLAKLLNTEPNPEMTAFGFRELTLWRMLLWGNAPAEIERANDGRPLALWPIHPSRVTPKRSGGELYYEVKQAGGYDDPGRSGRRPARLAAVDLFNPTVRGDGVWGESVISYAKNNLGLGLATEQFGASLFANKSHPGGIIETPARLSAEQRDDVRREWEKASGPENAHKLRVLTGGSKYVAVGIPPEDAQFLESRKFSVTDVARWFGLPPHKLADLERATFSNIEESNIEFLERLLPWMLRVEQEAERKLIAARNVGRMFVDHDVDALLRANRAARGDYYAKMRQWGVLSANDVRGREGLAPVDGGDIYLTPANMVDAATLTDPPEPPATPPVAGDPTSPDGSPSLPSAPPATGEPTGGLDPSNNGRAEELAEARRLIAAELARTAAKEAAEMAAAARSPKAFVRRLEAFAVRQHAKLITALSPVATRLAGVGIVLDVASLADSYAEACRAGWLDLAGRATAAELVDAAREYSDNERNADELVDVDRYLDP